MVFPKIHFFFLYCYLVKITKEIMLNNVLDKKRNAHQNHGLTSFEKSQFLSTFLTCCFYSLERLVFFSQYFQTHFAELFCLYKKIPNFRLFLACSFYSLEKLFFFLENSQTHFAELFSRY